MEPIRSYRPIDCSLPLKTGGSALALVVSRPAQRLLTLWPARSPSRHRDPLHRRLQRLRYLCRCFDCYRVERTSSRAGLSPAVDRRLFTAHSYRQLILDFETVADLLSLLGVDCNVTAEWPVSHPQLATVLSGPRKPGGLGAQGARQRRSRLCRKRGLTRHSEQLLRSRAKGRYGLQRESLFLFGLGRREFPSLRD